MLVKLTIGGYNKTGAKIQKIESFDGTNWQHWQYAKTVWGHCVVKIDDSNIILIGGDEDTNYFYNALLNRWTLGIKFTLNI